MSFPKKLCGRDAVQIERAASKLAAHHWFAFSGFLVLGVLVFLLKRVVRRYGYILVISFARTSRYLPACGSIGSFEQTLYSYYAGAKKSEGPLNCPISAYFDATPGRIWHANFVNNHTRYLVSLAP